MPRVRKEPKPKISHSSEQIQADYEKSLSNLKSTPGLIARQKVARGNQLIAIKNARLIHERTNKNKGDWKNAVSQAWKSSDFTPIQLKF
jgi:hypothetical protein